MDSNQWHRRGCLKLCRSASEGLCSSGVKNYIANTDALLTTNHPMLPLRSDLILPQRAYIADAGLGTSTWIGNGVDGKVTDVIPFNSNCGGKFCDKQGLLKDGVVSQRCSYFQMNSRTHTRNCNHYCCYTGRWHILHDQQVFQSDFLHGLSIQK